jgi:type II secretory pathway predicted ATPase ExeA
MLTNHEMDSQSPFACLLVGQPTLRRRIKFGELAALDQRIAVRYQMTGMALEETASYIAHDLKLAGRADTLFSDDAIALIHQTSRGYPRMVNNLASQALIAALATGKAIVDESSPRTAVTATTPTRITPSDGQQEGATTSTVAVPSRWRSVTSTPSTT